MSNNSNNKEIMFYPSKFIFWLWNIISFVIFILGLMILYFSVTSIFTVNRSYQFDLLYAILLGIIFLYQSIIYIKTPFLYYNESQGYLKIKDRIVPLGEITAYKHKRFVWKKLFCLDFYKCEYELILKNGDAVTFYGFYRGSDIEVEKTLNKIGIYKYNYRSMS